MYPIVCPCGWFYLRTPVQFRNGFRVEPVPMKNTHHEVIRELLILKP